MGEKGSLIKNSGPKALFSVIILNMSRADKTLDPWGVAHNFCRFNFQNSYLLEEEIPEVSFTLLKFKGRCTAGIINTLF